MEIITRDQALERGLRFFFTGKSCKYGHIAERYSSNGICSACNHVYHKKYYKPKRLQTIEERLNVIFWRYFKEGDKDECWEWQGRRQYLSGYGVVKACLNNKLTSVYAHRMAYEKFVGPIPDGYHVCHHCDNPSCVNSNHLFTGTDTDNHQDKVNKGRQTRGESHGGHILTEDIVRKLRNGELKPSKELAIELGISDVSHLYRIRNGTHWTHIT